MKIVAIMPVRNEAWVLGFSLRALLRIADHVVVLLHNCTDESRAITSKVGREHPGRVTFLDRNDSGVWQEMDNRQELLDLVRELKGTHVLTIDADEAVTANLIPSMRSSEHATGIIEAMPAGHNLQIPWIQCRGGSIERFIISGQWAQQDVSIGFVDHSTYHWKAQRDGYQHHHRAPMGMPELPHRPLGPAFLNRWQVPDVGGLLHLQMVSERRLRAKQALYVMNERLRWPEREMPDYAGTVNAPGHVLGYCPPQWWDGYNDILKYLHVDAEPWQSGECLRLWELHGAKTFKGLDLFGVVG